MYTTPAGNNIKKVTVQVYIGKRKVLGEHVDQVLRSTVHLGFNFYADTLVHAWV